MPERPLLSIPAPERVERVKDRSAFDPNAGLVRPERGRQSERLGPKFERLRRVMADQADQPTMALRADADGLAPERAVVFEVAGSLADFYNQVQRIPGLEFLLDEEAEFDPDDDFHWTRRRGEEVFRLDDRVGGRLYVAMPNLQALRQLLSLWERFLRGEALPRGFAPWGSLFGLLHDVRPWGPADRVLPETIEFWRARLEAQPDVPVRFEVELWFHQLPDRRAAADDDVRRHVTALGGNVVSGASLEPIRYQGMLVDLPAARIRELIDNPTVTLARVDDIMYLRPQSIASFPVDTTEGAGVAEPPTPQPNTAEDPIVALLDGVPLTNHVLLDNRLVLDDPDDLQARAPVARRSHGTTMASLIVHGDRAATEPPLGRRIYVRPVMVYDVATGSETTPPERLPLDVIYDAVRRMKEGPDGGPGSAPSVVVINLSLGDANRPFTGSVSPWARLVDWLAFRYRVLFLVSAGNVLRWLRVPPYGTREEFVADDPQTREDHVLNALNVEKASRTLLSPGESLNALTVGAWHRDATTARTDPPTLTDAFASGELPNVSSGLGLGYRRTIKPELLFDGGRELLRTSVDDGAVWVRSAPDARNSGQLAAMSDPEARGRLNLLQRCCGTSNGTALLTRASAQIYDGLEESGYEIPAPHRAVLLKALLVHGARWGATGQRLEDLFGPPGNGWRIRRENVARFLGYGYPDIQRVLDCAAERATLFAYGDISRDLEDHFAIPLPPSLEGATAFRRLTLTLAWLTPVNARHQNYRVAVLDVSPTGDDEYSLAVSRVTSQPTHDSVTRGTTFHAVYEGEAAIAFVDQGRLKFKIACRAQAGTLDEPVPYAVAVSLETNIGSGIPVYQEVRAAVRAAIRA